MTKKELYYKVARLFYPVAIYYWATWSKVLRSLTRLRGMDLLRGLGPLHAQGLMDQLPWAADRWSDLWDGASDPTKFQRALDIKQTGGYVVDESRDCDDFAGWAACVLDEKYHARIMTVAYQGEATSSISGHVVCLYIDPADNNYYHMGNWGIRGKYPTILSAARGVAHEAKAKLVGYAVLQKNLDVDHIVRA